MSQTEANSNETLVAGQPDLKAFVHGEFRIVDESGQSFAPRSQKSCALIAMLLVMPDGARSRAWLRQHLWSDRGVAEGQSSLRQSLTEIRKVFQQHKSCIEIDRKMVRINPDIVQIEATSGEFLENLSIQDPEFNAWLREMRRRSPYAAGAQAVAPGLLLGGQVGQAEAAPVTTFTYPTVSVEADVSAHVPPELAEAMHKMRIALTQFRWLSVQSSVQGINTADYVVRVGQDFGKTQANHISLTTAEGQILWSDRQGADVGTGASMGLDISFLDVAVGNIAVLISNAEEQRAADAPQDNDLCNLLWRGRWHLNHMSRRDAEEANLILQRAQQLAPHDVNVAIDIAYAAVARAWVFRLNRPELQDIIRVAKRATARAPNDARGFYNLGTALCFAREMESARIAIDEAIRLCPNMAMAWIQQGCNLLGEGRFEEAVPVYHRCLMLGQFERRSYVPRCGLAMAYLFLGDNQAAIDTVERAIALRPGYWYAHMIHGVACWRLGQKDKARMSFATMRAIHPHVSRRDVEWLPTGDQNALNRLILDAGLAD